MNPRKENIKEFLESIFLFSIEQVEIDWITVPITVQEIEDASLTLSFNRSPGLDGFMSEFYISFREILRKQLLIVFHHCLFLKKFPASWKEGRITLIHKLGKNPTHSFIPSLNASEYRLQNPGQSVG